MVSSNQDSSEFGGGILTSRRSSLREAGVQPRHHGSAQAFGADPFRVGMDGRRPTLGGGQAGSSARHGRFPNGSVEQMQAQLHINTGIVDQIIRDQHQLAAQVDVVGKAIARMTLEHMAREMDTSLDSGSQLSDPPSSPPRPPVRSKPGPSHQHR